MKRLLFLVAAIIFTGAAFAQSQNYPNRPLRIIIPWPPGQATDLCGRVVALQLSTLLGSSSSVANQLASDDSITAVIGPANSEDARRVVSIFIAHHKPIISPAATSAALFRAFAGCGKLLRCAICFAKRI